MNNIGVKWYDKEVIVRVNALVADHMDTAGEWVAQRAQALAPVRSGRLKKGIDYVVIGKGDVISAVVGVTKKSGAWYARFQEQGTKHMKAQPFLRPAVFDNQKTIERIVRYGK